MTWVLHTMNAKKRRRTFRTVRKGVANGEVMVEEGDWENNITSPETDTTESAKLRFPNPAKFESDFSSIYQIDKSGVRDRYNQGVTSDQPKYNKEGNSDQQRYNQDRSSIKLKRRNSRHSWRSSSLDQSSISCYNELNRTFKSNCDLHFSTGSRSGSVKYSHQHVRDNSYRTIQPPHSDQVENTKFQSPTCSCRSKDAMTISSPQYWGNENLIVNKNSYSTDV